MNDLISTIYIIVAIAEIVILEYIIRQVDNDRINNLDPPWVRWSRRASFTGGELFLCFTMYGIGWLWLPSWIDVGLISAGILILSVNIVSLHLRAPPSNTGSKIRNVGAISHIASARTGLAPSRRERHDSQK